MKRNISKGFNTQTDLSQMQEWIKENIQQAVDEKSKLNQKVRINICFDPDSKQTMTIKRRFV